jgi:hypothetical protein
MTRCLKLEKRNCASGLIELIVALKVSSLNDVSSLYGAFIISKLLAQFSPNSPLVLLISRKAYKKENFN